MGEPIYKCTCGMTFVDYRTANRHLADHTGPQSHIMSSGEFLEDAYDDPQLKPGAGPLPSFVCGGCGFVLNSQTILYHECPANSGDIGELQKVIAQWADTVFPTRTAHDAAVKLMLHEIPEWLDTMDDPLEFADLVILILDIAHLKGIDIKKAVLNKMEINRARKWTVDPRTRLMQHKEESNEA